MIDLTEEQQIKLKALICIADFTDYNEERVSAVIDAEYRKLSERQLDMAEFDGIAMARLDEWRAVLNSVKADSVLMNLKVKNLRSPNLSEADGKEPHYEDDTYFDGVCLVNDVGEEAVVFRSAEYQSTRQREKVSEYIKSPEFGDLLEIGYSDSEAATVEGQGFSEPFVENRMSEISVRPYKVYALNDEKEPESVTENTPEIITESITKNIAVYPVDTKKTDITLGSIYDINKGFDIKTAEINSILQVGAENETILPKGGERTDKAEIKHLFPEKVLGDLIGKSLIESEQGLIFNYLMSGGTAENTGLDYGNDTAVFFYALESPTVYEKTAILPGREVIEHDSAAVPFRLTEMGIGTSPAAQNIINAATTPPERGGAGMSDYDFKALLDDKVGKDDIMGIFAEKLLEESRVTPPSPYSHLTH